jgi:xylan 1,4-beta-xylosidase
LKASDAEATPVRYTFDAPQRLPADFQWFRSPLPDRLFSLSDRPGHLRLTGHESIGSTFEQALVVRRQTDFDFDVETDVDAEPTSYHQMAGLDDYYNGFAYHYLCLTHDEEYDRSLQILSCPGGWPQGNTELMLEQSVAAPQGPVRMKLEVRGAASRFYYWHDGWTRMGPLLDQSALSDENGEGEYANFTGAFFLAWPQTIRAVRQCTRISRIFLTRLGLERNGTGDPCFAS